MYNRRSFIRQSAALLGGLALHQDLKGAYPSVNTHRPASLTAQDDDFWRQIRQEYSASPLLTNLNNAGVSPTPRAAAEALDYYNKFCNEAPSYNMWRILDNNREVLRAKLADLAGVSPDEIAITRNATESLNSIVFGLNLKKGDEIVLSYYDYPHMKSAWAQRAKRDGIKLVWVDFEMPSEDEQYLIEAYTSKFSGKTRLVHLTHLINWTGQILPVTKIADLAHAQGIEVLVDGAQTFAHLDYKIPDLHCDYWGTSLHKWLCAPYGNGMTWIKKEKIPEIWPLLGDNNPNSDNIRKMENLGTRSFPIEMATGYSIDLHNMIGSKRKEERLFSLKNYWMERVKEKKNIKFFTSMKPEWGCGICTFALEGQSPYETADKLFKDHRIHTTFMDVHNLKCVRVSPHVYTTEQDLDKLVEAILKM